MDGKQSFLRNPGVQAALFVVVVVAAYVYLSLPANPATDVVVRGGLAYFVAGRDGLQVVDISDLKNLVKVGEYDTPGDATRLAVRCYPDEKNCEQIVAFVVDGIRGVRILDVTDARAIREVSVISSGEVDRIFYLLDVVDLVLEDNLAYVLDRNVGLLIFNVEQHGQPRQMGAYKPEFGGKFRCVDLRGKTAYVVNNKGQFYAINVSDPSNPKKDNTKSFDTKISHPREMTIVGNLAYLATRKQGLAIVNLDEKGQVEVDDEKRKASTFGENVHDVVVDGPYAYLASGNRGLYIVDISRPKNLTEVAHLEKIGDARGVTVLENNIFIANGSDGLRSVSFESTFSFKGDKKLLRPEVIVEALATKENYAYLAVSQQGLLKMDISNPSAPKEIGSPLTLGEGGEAVGVSLTPDYAFVSVRNAGLFSVYLSPSGGMELKGTFDKAKDARMVAVKSPHLFLAGGSEGVWVISFTDPSKMEQVGLYKVEGGEANAIVIRGNHALVAYGAAGLRVVDISKPKEPREVGALPTSQPVEGIFVADSRAFLAIGKDGLLAVDVSDPAHPKVAGGPIAWGETASAHSVMVKDSFAYVAVGEGGLVVVNISQPANMITVAKLPITPAAAFNLALGEKSPYVYLASRDHGMRVVNIETPAAPQTVGFMDSFQQARDVFATADRAYVLDGQGDMQVVDITNPDEPRVIGFADLSGSAQKVEVVKSIAYLASGEEGLVLVDISNAIAPRVVAKFDTPGNVMNVTLVEKEDKLIAYLADGSGGLWLVDVSNLDSIHEIGSYPPENIMAIDVAVKDSYLLVADQNDGLLILNASNPADILPTSSWDEDIQHAVAVAVVDNFVYLADASRGLAVVDVSDIGNPKLLSLHETGGITNMLIADGFAYLTFAEGGLAMLDVRDPGSIVQVDSLDIPGDHAGVSLASGYLYVSTSSDGLWVREVKRKITLSAIGLYETPGMVSLRWLLKSMLFPFMGRGGELTPKMIQARNQLLFDVLILFGVGMLFWRVFFAQFVLPLRTLGDRFNAAMRVNSFGLGNLLFFGSPNGPAIFVENGKIEASKGEQERRGPGVVFLDTASGAVLRTATAFTRTIGPGVHFTRNRERLVGAVGLHNQFYPFPFMGPRGGPEGYEDPFAERQKSESEEAYRERQKRRMATSGLTRDGVEVVPRVAAGFHLRGQSKSVWDWTQFEYDADAVRLAITHEGIGQTKERDSDGEKHIPWIEVPVNLVVDLWREYLHKFTLIELFDPKTAENKGLESLIFPEKRDRGMTGIEVIKQMVRKRLTQPEVDELDEVGRLVPGRTIESREYHLLESMGVHFEFSVIGSFQFPPGVESKLEELWWSEWGQRAEIERRLVDQRRAYAAHKGQEQAVKEFAAASGKILGDALARTPSVSLDLPATLDMLLRGTRQRVAGDLPLHSRLSSEERELVNLIEWVRRRMT